MSAYYNEIDPFAAEWLRNLILAGEIADGEVDTRSIADVSAGDVRGFTQCHWFAGLGGWSAALRLAGWADERAVWTGSCPCQPWSMAGSGEGTDDPRHLWPAWFGLIRECRPRTIYGEQVASLDGLYWLDLVFDGLERENYAVWAADIAGACVGSPDIRQRLWFVADSDEAGCGRQRLDRVSENVHAQPRPDVDGCREVGGMAHSEISRRRPRRDVESNRTSLESCRSRAVGELGDSNNEREAALRRVSGRQAVERGRSTWSSADWLPCRDGKDRPVEPGSFPLVAGLPVSMGRAEPELQRLANLAGLDGASLKRAKGNRTGRLRGYGNAIKPRVAAEFIRAYLEAREVTS